MAGTQDRAKSAIYGVINPFNELRRQLEALVACCPLPAEAGDSGKTKDAKNKP